MFRSLRSRGFRRLGKWPQRIPPKTLEEARKFIVRRVRSNPDLVEVVDHAFDLALSYFFFEWRPKQRMAEKKTPSLLAICENCNYKWVAGFSNTPEAERQALLARMAVCARCLEGDRIRFFEISGIRPSPSQDFERTTLPVFKHTKRELRSNSPERPERLSSRQLYNQLDAGHKVPKSIRPKT